MRTSQLKDINIANSSSFVSIGSGNYYFFSRGIFSKRAYVVSKKEKKDLESLSSNSMLKLIGVGTFFTTAAFINMYGAVLGVSLFGFYLCFHIKQGIKKILNDKEIIIVTERKWTNYFITNAKQYTYKNIFHRLGVSLLLFFIPWFAGAKKSGDFIYFKYIMIFVALFVTTAIVYDLFHLFFKIGSDLSTKRKK